MNILPVTVHSDAWLGVKGPALPIRELEHICVLLSTGPGAANFLKLRQIGSSYPGDQKLSFIGIYEVVWNFQGKDWYVYMTNSGFTPIEIRRSSENPLSLPNSEHQQWLDRALNLNRRLHEILSSSESGV